MWDSSPHVMRELALIKIAATPKTRSMVFRVG